MPNKKIASSLKGLTMPKGALSTSYPLAFRFTPHITEIINF